MDSDSGPSIASSEGSDDSLEFVSRLPHLTKDDLTTAAVDEACPICLLPLQDFLDEINPPPTSLTVDENDQCVHKGVTMIEGCGHVFCRQDLAEWIIGGHGSCPLCRHVFLEIQIPQEPESSDGGEYLPSSDFGDADDQMDYDDASEVASDWHDESEWVDEDSWLTTDAEAEPGEMEDSTGLPRAINNSDNAGVPEGVHNIVSELENEGDEMEEVELEDSKYPQSRQVREQSGSPQEYSTTE